jgi:hypothetical protein
VSHAVMPVILTAFKKIKPFLHCQPLGQSSFEKQLKMHVEGSRCRERERVVDVERGVGRCHALDLTPITWARPLTPSLEAHLRRIC